MSEPQIPNHAGSPVAPQIGVCSWSLRPDGPDDLIQKVQACELSAVQIALDPIRCGRWDEAATVKSIKAAGMTLPSGMMAMRGEDYSTLASIRETGGVRQDQHWPENLAAAHANAALARRMNIHLITFHAGFLPHETADPLRKVMLDRLRQMADAFAAQQVNIAFETGQESAETLCSVLRDLNHPNIGVNFDPANMILYGMGDPLDAFVMLAKWVRQVHIKDAVAANEPGTWGREVSVGRGSVDWPAFLRLVHRYTPQVNLIIERESGTHAVDDIHAAKNLVASILEGS